ncbi:O-antigen/teichoic acid export membrane protein [Weissella uvarum]|uniref:lipopolysaccharide biosynthesis protein n=1 Tax=Weissella uvarum TaxID=1479233 RepID=UPI00195F9C3A|nr:oligosaccharide flippase family protein [Weissella uvarum]MBM7617967.1 O-antigen/teichoic acid export membrane protein [Weissella uvarum]MCM0596186.1 oligosaccharide flippase family protein [Weissella uvarum]
MNRYKKLLGNSAIFAIGSLGSKLISFLLVPFYTYVLSRTQFGTVDLITTTVSLLLPIVSLSIFDAVFRFVMDRDENPNQIFTNGVLVTCLGSLIGLLIIPLLSYFHIEYSGYIYALMVSGAFLSLLSNFSRAIGKVKVFAMAGILGTFITAASNILLLVVLRQGVDGYLVSIFLSNVLVCGYLIMATQAWQRIKRRYVNKHLIRELLMYSIPLIPNAFSWWINSSADRYFILLYVGAAANGLYAVASKLPTVLNVVNQIFFQAWQMSAVEEYESEDASEFYSQTFNAFMKFQFICVAGILFILKPLMHILVSAEFYVAWRYIPFLMLAVVYSSLSGFLGTTYLAAKNTSGVLLTTIVGAAANILFGFLCVPIWGLQGASLAGAISFFIVLVVRLFDTKRFMPILVDKASFIVNHVIIFMMIGLLFSQFGIIYLELLEAVLLLMLIMINREVLMDMFKLVLKH